MLKEYVIPFTVELVRGIIAFGGMAALYWLFWQWMVFYLG